MRIHPVIAGAVLLCVAAGCRSETSPVDASVDSGKPAGVETVAVPVQAEKPARGEIAELFETNARIVAERRVEVTAEGVGKCLQVFAEEGEEVAKGGVLAELDKQEALAALRQAEVQVRQQYAAYERARKMYQEGLGTKLEYENAKFGYEQSLANYNLQKVQLDNLTIRAPIGGVVTRKNIQVGMLVTSGTPVYSIVDPTSYQLDINPPERDLPRLKVGQVARVSIDALPGYEFKATVRRINPSVENGTVKATLDFVQEDLPRLKEGAFARVGLVLETHENALLLPKDAVLEENGREYVFVVEPAEAVPSDAAATGKPRTVARRVDIETGLDNSVSAEILSGLDDDDLVATVGQHTLKSGTEVVVTEPERELAAGIEKTPEEALAAAKAERAAGKEPMASSDRHR